MCEHLPIEISSTGYHDISYSVLTHAMLYIAMYRFNWLPCCMLQCIYLIFPSVSFVCPCLKKQAIDQKLKTTIGISPDIHQ